MLGNKTSSSCTFSIKWSNKYPVLSNGYLSPLLTFLSYAFFIASLGKPHIFSIVRLKLVTSRSSSFDTASELFIILNLSLKTSPGTSMENSAPLLKLSPFFNENQLTPYVSPCCFPRFADITPLSIIISNASMVVP